MTRASSFVSCGGIPFQWNILGTQQPGVAYAALVNRHAEHVANVLQIFAGRSKVCTKCSQQPPVAHSLNSLRVWVLQLGVPQESVRKGGQESLSGGGGRVNRFSLRALICWQGGHTFETCFTAWQKISFLSMGTSR